MSVPASSAGVIDLASQYDSLRVEFDEYRADSAALESELESELATATARATAAESRTRQVEMNVDQLTQKLRGAEQSVSALRSELASAVTRLNEQLSTANRTIRTLERQVDALTNKLRVAESAADDYKEKLEAQQELNIMRTTHDAHDAHNGYNAPTASAHADTLIRSLRHSVIALADMSAALQNASATTSLVPSPAQSTSTTRTHTRATSVADIAECDDVTILTSSVAEMTESFKSIIQSIQHNMPL